MTSPRNNPLAYLGVRAQRPPNIITATRAPTANDTTHEIGTIWIDQTAQLSYQLIIVTAGSATWGVLSPGASDVDTINSLAPVAGNIIIDGGTNVTDVNAGNTVTLNLDDAITLATSVTSPIYASAAAMAINPVGALTVTGGTTIDINAAAGQNITMQMGDAVGANVIDFEDSASATVASLDSNGTLTVVNMDGIIGATTPAAITGTTITANTSVVSPLFTAAAADALIQAGGANDVVVRLGDNAGATYFRVQDSDSADVWTIDSNGTFAAFAGLTVTGAFAQTGGTFNAGADATANAVNIGTGAAAKPITIGNVTGASSLDLLAGTGNFSLEGNVATTYAISNVGANTGQVDIAGGTGARTINLGLGGTGIKTINIGTAATADVISIGDGTGAGSLSMDAGSGGFSLDSTGASNITVTSAGLDLDIQGVGCAVTISSTETENDAIDIEASAANGGVVIAAGTGGIRIGDEADCTGLTFGNIAPTANRNITIGSGTVVTASVTDDISIGDGGATTNVDSIKHVDINNGGVTLGEVNTYIAGGAVTSGTHLTEIACGNVAAGTATLNISDGTGTKTVNLGNADANTTLNIDAVTVINDNVNAAFSACTGTSTGTVTLGNVANSTAMVLESSTTLTADTAGNIAINSSGGTILIGNDDVDQNMGFGTDGERTVTVGSTNGAAGLVLQAGTGEITMTGTVKQIDAELMGTTGVYIPTINMSPVMTTAANTGGAPTGATGDVNLMSLQNQAIMSQFILGAGQTIIAPRMTANGLLISLDLTATEGAEYGFEGALDSTFGFTVGTSGAFFFELDLYINDMDGADPYIFGFRKTEANNATFANYTDYYALGMNAGTSVTNLVIFDELNATGQTITDTTDAWGGDGTTNTLRIDVSAAGVCTSYINGVIATAAPAFTFDADRVTPFIRLTHSASPTQVAITGMRIGLQA